MTMNERSVEMKMRGLLELLLLLLIINLWKPCKVSKVLSNLYYTIGRANTQDKRLIAQNLFLNSGYSYFTRKSENLGQLSLIVNT